MRTTVTNSSSTLTLNTPVTYDTRVDSLLTAGIVAVGGAVRRGLPHPFDRVGEIAASAAITRSMNPEDWHHYIFGTSHTAINIWRQLVQASKLTLGFAVDAVRNDPEELSINVI